MESVIDHAGSNLVKEASDELFGRSKRSWALIVVAFILGGVVALAVIYSAKRKAAETDGGPDADTALNSGSPASEARPSNSLKTRIARSDAVMRVRVGRAGSRLNVFQHAPVAQEREADVALDPTAPRA